MSAAELIFAFLAKSIGALSAKVISDKATPFLTQIRVEATLKQSLAKTVQALLPLFEAERYDTRKLGLLIETLDQEFSILIEQPQEFFSASLDGHKLFRDRYQDGLPKTIVEEDLQVVYQQIFPHIAVTLFEIPSALEAWKKEHYAETFRRFDDVTERLVNLAAQVSAASISNRSEREELYATCLTAVLQQSIFQLELEALRGDRPEAVPLDKCFVIPKLRLLAKGNIQQLPPDTATIAPTVNDLTVKHGLHLIFGPPGVGKSTLAKWLQQESLTKNKIIAVVTRYRDLQRDGVFPTLREVLATAMNPVANDLLDNQSVTKWANASQLLLILDGFDEVATEKRDEYLSWTRNIAQFLERSAVIVTSRPISSHHTWSLAEQADAAYLVEPFNQTQIQEFIENWYLYAPLLQESERSAASAELAAAWLHDPSLRPLVQIPLLLATLLMVHHLDGELPKGRSKLYERYVQGMLGLWDNRRSIQTTLRLTIDDKIEILARIAVKLFSNGTDELRDQDVIDCVKSVLHELAADGEAVSIGLHILERSGLVVGPVSWHFSHKSIQEYFVAYAIWQGNQNLDSGHRLDRHFLATAPMEDRWLYIVLFWCGLCSTSELHDFIERLTFREECFDLSLAMKVISEQTSPGRLSRSDCCRFLNEVLMKAHVFETQARSHRGFTMYPRPGGAYEGLMAPVFEGLGRFDSSLDLAEKCFEAAEHSLDCLPERRNATIGYLRFIRLMKLGPSELELSWFLDEEVRAQLIVFVESVGLDAELTLEFVKARCPDLAGAIALCVFMITMSVDRLEGLPENRRLQLTLGLELLHGECDGALLVSDWELDDAAPLSPLTAINDLLSSGLQSRFVSHMGQTMAEAVVAFARSIK